MSQVSRSSELPSRERAAELAYILKQELETLESGYWDVSFVSAVMSSYGKRKSDTAAILRAALDGEEKP